MSQRRDDAEHVRGSEEAGRDDVTAEAGKMTRHVDAFAADVRALRRGTIRRPGGEAGHHENAIDRRIRRHGDDHRRRRTLVRWGSRATALAMWSLTPRCPRAS